MKFKFVLMGFTLQGDEYFLGAEADLAESILPESVLRDPHFSGRTALGPTDVPMSLVFYPAPYPLNPVADPEIQSQGFSSHEFPMCPKESANLPRILVRVSGHLRYL